MKQKTIHIIAGTTASGKSDFAIKLAKKISGCVINADSLQVYQDIPLLTARPTPLDEEIVPHYLYGYLDCYTTGTVSDWLEKVSKTLTQSENPVVVGGTGMYIKALTEGFNQMPDIDPVIRQQVREMPLHDVKKQVLECSATDPQRLRRALEVQLSTGKTLRWFQQQPPKKYIHADFNIIWINKPREEIRQRCQHRFMSMLEQGAIQQVIDLKNKKPTGGVTQAIGYHQICDYLDKKISEEEMINLSVTATCQYAKRQNTWFKNQLVNPIIITDTNKEL